MHKPLLNSFARALESWAKQPGAGLVCELVQRDAVPGGLTAVRNYRAAHTDASLEEAIAALATPAKVTLNLKGLRAMGVVVNVID